MANRIASEINDEYGTQININKAGFSLNGDIDLNNFLIKDHKSDTLIFFRNLYLSPVNLGKLISNDFNFSSISFNTLELKISNYLGDESNSLEVFLNNISKKNNSKFNDVKKLSFASKLTAENSKIQFIDQQNPSNNFILTDINFLIKDLSLENSNFDFKIENFSTVFDNKIFVENFESNFYKRDSIINFNNTKIKFGSSEIVGNFNLDYSEILSSNFSSSNFVDFLKIDLNIINSKLISTDLGNILPTLKTSYDATWVVDANINGYTNDLNIDKLSLENKKNKINIKSNLKNILNENYSLNFNLLDFDVDSEEINIAFPKFFGTILPSSLKSFGRFNIKGIIDITQQDIKSKLNLNTNEGLIKANLSLYDFSNIDNASYEGKIIGVNLDLSRFLNSKEISDSNFEFNIKGKGFTRELLNSRIYGSISNLNIYDYDLKNIDLSGVVNDQIFDGKSSVSDENVSLNFNGLIDFSEDLVDFDFNLDLLNTNLNIFNKKSDASLSANVNVKLRGSNIENVIGDLSINDLKYFNNKFTNSFDDFQAQLRYNDDIRILNLISQDAISGVIIGEYDIFNIKNIFINNIGNHYSNFKTNDQVDFKNISFNLNLKPKLAQLLSYNLDIDESTFISGDFKENGEYKIELKSNYINYNELKAEAIDISFNNKSGFFKINKLNSQFLEGTNFNIKSQFQNDTLYVDSNYKSFDDNNNKLNFYHTIDTDENSIFGFTNLDLVFNKNNWSIEEALNPNLVIDSNFKEFKASNISLISDQQKIKLDLIDSNSSSDYNISFYDVDLASFTNISNTIFFNGRINGNISVTKNDQTYSGDSNVSITNLKANNQDLGSAVLKLNASEDSSQIELDFKINNNQKEKLNLFGSFAIEEDYFPLDMILTTQDFNISPFSKIGKNVINDFEGFFNSEIIIRGNSLNPVFYGSIQTSNVAFHLPYLNVRYEIDNNSTFFLDDQSFFIDDFTLLNNLTETKGIISGKISHNLFKKWFLELDINTDNLLILNTKFSDNDLYYGKGMFNGNAIIYGPTDNLLIKLNGSTNKNTSLVIPINDSKNIGNLKFLNFVDPSISYDENELKTKSLLVDLDIDFNTNANLEVILDSESQSKINGVGNGKLNFKINTLGNFNMFGDYTIERGSYYYRTLGIINREFELLKGSRITWNGDPYLGELNINANYEIPGGANPAILIQNTSFNRKIPTTVNVNLEGNFNEMKTPSFKINFPNTRGPIKSELNYYLIDDEKRQKQALSLLYQGSFIDEVSLSSISSQAITNNLFQSASGLLDNIFTNSEDKMNIGINYLQGDRNSSSSLLNRDRLGLTLKSEISDRILLNGKIGVPVGGVEENVIIGDVQIEFLLNEEGNLKARFFNKENEYQYFGDDIGYTQGLGLSYEIDFNSIRTLFKKQNQNKSKRIK